MIAQKNSLASPRLHHRKSPDLSISSYDAPARPLEEAHQEETPMAGDPLGDDGEQAHLVEDHQEEDHPEVQDQETTLSLLQ